MNAVIPGDCTRFRTGKTTGRRGVTESTTASRLYTIARSHRFTRGSSTPPRSVPTPSRTMRAQVSSSSPKSRLPSRRAQSGSVCSRRVRTRETLNCPMTGSRTVWMNSKHRAASTQTSSTTLSWRSPVGTFEKRSSLSGTSRSRVAGRWLAPSRIRLTSRTSRSSVWEG